MLLRLLSDRLSLYVYALLLLMRANTRKLTTAAVCTALAILLCVCTAYLPLSVMPLYLAALCIFIACRRCGVVYGLLCAAASVGLMFLMTGLSVKWFVFLFMFAPYGIATSFAHKFDYFRVKRAIVRGLIAAAYFNLTFGMIYVIAVKVTGVGLDVPVADWAGKLGGYYVLALIATAVLVPLDVVFTGLSAVLLRYVPAIKDKKRRPPVSDSGVAATDGDTSYDIFGYETKRSGETFESGQKGEGGQNGETSVDGENKPDDEKNGSADGLGE